MPKSTGPSQRPRLLAARRRCPQPQLHGRESVGLDPGDDASEAAVVVVIVAERERPMNDHASAMQLGHALGQLGRPGVVAQRVELDRQLVLELVEPLLLEPSRA